MTSKIETPFYDSLDDKAKDIVDYYMNVKRVKYRAYVECMHPGGKKDIDFDYENARKAASNFFTNIDIKQAIDEKFKEIWATRQERHGKLMDELENMAYSDVKNVFDFEKGITIKDLSEEDTRSIKSVKINRQSTKHTKIEDKDVVIETDIIQIEMHDKNKAIGHIKDINGLNKLVLEDVTDFSKQQEKLDLLTKKLKEKVNGGV